MRHLIFTLLSLVSLNCFGQKTTEYKIDDNLTINIPESFEVYDRFEQRIIKATFDYGAIIISKMALEENASVNIRDEKELIEFYDGVQKGVLGSSKGELISGNIIEINKLKLIRFSYRAKMDEEAQIRDFLGLLLNDSIYSFHYLQLESKADEMKSEKDAFFASLKIHPGLSLKSQFTNSNVETTSYNLGYSIGYLFGYILVFGTLALIIVLILKRNKKKTRTTIE